jgi:hypothetical protein
MNRSFSLGLLFVLLLAAATPLNAQPPKPLDFEVKATYLLNFGRFATWPATSPTVERDDFPVCVIGSDPFGSALDHTVAGESIDGRGVVVKRIAHPEEVAKCRILFVSGSEEAQLSAILPVAEKAGVLTVSDIAVFAARGGMIQFVSQDRKIRFRVNATAAEQAGLTLSSELLRVAVAVVRSTP